MTGGPYCGCCGTDRDVQDGMWCRRCISHIRKERVALWERTYFAQHGVPCPYDVSAREDAYQELLLRNPDRG